MLAQIDEVVKASQNEMTYISRSQVISLLIQEALKAREVTRKHDQSVGA
jgi:metal-responsive CopG/Arc/MetJ family transcriptional regulator